MNVFELFAKISLDKSEYDQGLSDAQDSANDFKDKFNSGTKQVTSGLKSVGVGVGVFAAVGTAAFKAANGVSQNLDQIDKMSQKIGLSAKAYQEWDYVLQINGSSIDSMTAGMKTLTNKFDEAMTGSKSATETFERLGLSMEDIQGLSREDLLSEVIFAFQDMEDSAERAALANDLFGRSGMELAPLFNSTKEETQGLIQQINDLGGVMSDDAVKDGAAFQDSLTNVKKAFEGASTTLMEKLLPTITMLMDKFTEFVESGGLDALIDQLTALAPVIMAVVTAFAGFKIVSGLISIIQGFSTVMGVLNAVMLANPIGLVIAAIGALVAAFVYLWNTSDSFRQFWIDVWNAVKDSFAKVVSWLGSVFTEKIPQMVGNVINFFKELPQKALTWGKDMIQNFIDGIKSMINKVGDAVKSIGSKIKGLIGFSEPEDPESPLHDFHTYAPDMMELFSSGIKDNASLITDAISGSFNLQPQIRNAVGTVETTQGAGMNGTFVIPVYIGGDKVDEYVLNAQDVYNYRSGGR